MQLRCSSLDWIMLRLDYMSCSQFICRFASAKASWSDYTVCLRLSISRPCFDYFSYSSFLSYQTMSSLCQAYLSIKFSSLTRSCSFFSLSSMKSCSFSLCSWKKCSSFLLTFSLSSSSTALRLMFSASRFWLMNSSLVIYCLYLAIQESYSLISYSKVCQSWMICISSIWAWLGSFMMQWMKVSFAGQRMQTMKTRCRRTSSPSSDSPLAISIKLTVERLLGGLILSVSFRYLSTSSQIFFSLAQFSLHSLEMVVLRISNPSMRERSYSSSWQLRTYKMDLISISVADCSHKTSASALPSILSINLSSNQIAIRQTDFCTSWIQNCNYCVNREGIGSSNS